MDTPDPPTYRIPSSLRDLVMVDLLELTGSTIATATMLQMSQPSISRRYRSLADDLGLERQNHRPIGRRYADTAWMGLLRRGVNRHRHACGVLRIGGPPDLEQVLRGCEWVEWVEVGRQALAHWPQLLQLELLDAVVHGDPAAMEEHGDLAGLALAEIRRAPSQSVLLTCRRDPLIMEIASRHCNWLEVP